MSKVVQIRMRSNEGYGTNFDAAVEDVRSLLQTVDAYQMRFTAQNAARAALEDRVRRALDVADQLQGLENQADLKKAVRELVGRALDGR